MNLNFVPLSTVSRLAVSPKSDTDAGTTVSDLQHCWRCVCLSAR